MPKTDAILTNLGTLQKAGYKIPDSLIKSYTEKGWEEKGVKQVWECVCGGVQQVYLPVTAVTCACSKPMKLHWQSPEL